MVNIRNFNKPDLVAIVYIYIGTVVHLCLRELNSFLFFHTMHVNGYPIFMLCMMFKPIQNSGIEQFSFLSYNAYEWKPDIYVMMLKPIQRHHVS